MLDEAAIARHRDEEHETERIEELGQFTVYYGHGSMTVQAFDWCPTCHDVWMREVMHAHGYAASRGRWEEMKRASLADERAARERAREYRDRRIAQAEPAPND